jgi:hypothetical protein
MSTGNIVSIEPQFVGIIPVGVMVTFKVRGPEGTRTYFYDAIDAVQMILDGADPSQFDGTRVD